MPTICNQSVHSVLKSVGFFLATSTFLGACASTGPSKQLVDARRAYDRASASPAQDNSLAGLHEAKEALGRAEAAHDEDPGSKREKHLSYLAERQSQQAMSVGNAQRYRQDRKDAKQEYQQVLRNRAENAADERDQAQAQLKNTRGRLDNTQEALSNERIARLKAEQEAREAMDRVSKIAKVKQDAKRVTITLSGSVIFETAKSKLLPTAKSKLDEVAKALRTYGDREITVRGHTDSRGSTAYNENLSKKRAQSVRQYLISQGIDQSRVDAEGVGESEPLAPNDTTEGRANNRRVEIVVAEG